MFARLIFAVVNFAARNGLTEASASSIQTAKTRARATGIRGETFAYWYLRRHGYTLVARNYTVPGIKGEIDLIGYDGRALAFVEVKTRSTALQQSTPEDAVNADKRRNLARMARQFLRSRRIDSASCRFDVLAIESQAGKKPIVRLHKSAFGMAPELSQQYR
jgi:putative endonuclease